VVGRYRGSVSRTEQAVVVGAGVSGLTTAACLAEAGWAVQVWSAEPPHETTSVVAGAMWGPSFQEPMAKTMSWTNASLDDFVALAHDPETGVRMAPALTVGGPAGGEIPPQARSIPDLRSATPDELPAGFAGGSRSTMPLVDMPRYLDHLVARLAKAGVEIEHRVVRGLGEAVDAAPVVVNCTGLGSADLLGDSELEPVFGQSVVLTNPGLDLLFMELSMNAEWTSFFPHPTRVVCGGIRIPGRTDRTPDPDLTERILARVRAIEPRLHDAELVAVETGLRPGRSAVRVEAEPLGNATVVHNYGHGGNGVSLSWGCAREVVALAIG
jgi:D-amino-acid oxidase